MIRFCTRSVLVILSLLQFSAAVYAGVLDDYYLLQFGEVKSALLQKAILSVSADVQESARCGTPLKHGLRRDWNLLEQSTQKVLAKQLALPTLSGTEQTAVSSGGHFTIHYTTSGTDAPHIDDYTVTVSGVPVLMRGINYYTGIASAADWAATVAATFENVYAQYGSLGYQLAPTISGTYDIYLHDLASQKYYGVTNSDQPASPATYPNAYTSWMEIDSSFTNSIYRPSTYAPLQSLQITAAHEYHHAIQYGYTYYFDVWYAEATSTWMEDELYDDVNQNYAYIPAWFSNSTASLDLWDSNPVSSGAGYGRWIFNRYLSEKHGSAMIRNVWEKAGGIASPGNGADIPMAPVLESVLSSTTYASTLGNDFFDFAKRVYTRVWNSHTSEIPKIHPYTPLASYSSVPVDYYTTPAPTVTLPHYSFAYYRFVPSSGAPSSLPITITGTSGITATVFRNDGSAIVEFPFTRVDSATITVPGFSTSSEVVLLITNATNSDNHSANFSTNGTGMPVTEPSGGTVYPLLLPVAPTTSTISGNKSGCFIATAAYGSYLHPQVQLLRRFRDDYLLTNAPGRAFVALYYRCSPPLADFIARHTLLRGMTRLFLTPFVVAVAHPQISAASLLLLIGTVLLLQLRRIKAAHSSARPRIILTTSSHIRETP